MIRKTECSSCSNTVEPHELAGYNVRHGRIIKAICYPCADYYGYSTKRSDWFERLWNKIRRIKVRAEARKELEREEVNSWEQTKLEIS